MASDQQRTLGSAGERDPLISGGIHVLLYRQAVQLGFEPGSGLEPGVRPGDALGAVLTGGERAQLL